MMDKEDSALRTIGEVAEELNLPAHVLRFWETKFPQLKPNKRRGRHRYYRPEDIEKLKQIRNLLYDQGYTIKGAQKFLRTERKEGEVKQVDLFAYSPPPAPSPAMQRVFKIDTPPPPPAPIAAPLPQPPATAAPTVPKVFKMDAPVTIQPPKPALGEAEIKRLEAMLEEITRFKEMLVTIP
jgi:DNA-binding transcriptional MerR regulator